MSAKGIEGTNETWGSIAKEVPVSDDKNQYSPMQMSKDYSGQLSCAEVPSDISDGSSLSMASFAGFALASAIKGMSGIGLLVVLEYHRAQKIMKSELAGYLDAKKDYLPKIKELESALNSVVKEADETLKPYAKLYFNSVMQVTARKTRITEMKLLLKLD